jgi:hypothetical protein
MAHRQGGQWTLYLCYWDLASFPASRPLGRAGRWTGRRVFVVCKLLLVTQTFSTLLWSWWIHVVEIETVGP